MNGPDAQLRAVAACKCVAETVLEVHHLTAQPKTRFSNKSVTPNHAQYQSHSGPTGALGHAAGTCNPPNTVFILLHNNYYKLCTIITIGANQINSQKLIVKIYKVFKEWEICKNRKVWWTRSSQNSRYRNW